MSGSGHRRQYSGGDCYSLERHALNAVIRMRGSGTFKPFPNRCEYCNTVRPDMVKNCRNCGAPP